MNIFEKTLKKEKNNNLPSTYTVSKNRKYQIRVSYITTFWLENKSYTDSIYNSDFENRHEFELMIYENFRKITKIHSSTQRTTETFILENGLLHNIKSFSYLKNENKYYFIHGKEFSESDFNIYIREEKLKRILNDDNKF